jgi:hypothetical protein
MSSDIRDLLDYINHHKEYENQDDDDDYYDDYPDDYSGLD